MNNPKIFQHSSPCEGEQYWRLSLGCSIEYWWYGRRFFRQQRQPWRAIIVRTGLGKEEEGESKNGVVNLSSIVEHEDTTGHRKSSNNFRIVWLDNNVYRLMIKEPRVIKAHEPRPNWTTHSVPLLVFPEGLERNLVPVLNGWISFSPPRLSQLSKRTTMTTPWRNLLSIGSSGPRSRCPLICHEYFPYSLITCWVGRKPFEMLFLENGIEVSDSSDLKFRLWWNRG